MKRDATAYPRVTARWREVVTLHGLWLLLLMLSGPINAQYVAETDPRVGEQRLNRFQFRATHNSFERNNGALDRVSIARQLDVYDVTLLEFDLTWNTEFGGGFYVMHNCADPAGRAFLGTYLNEIAATQRASKGVTFIYFNHTFTDCDLYPSVSGDERPADWLAQLKAALISGWDSSRFYTSQEFIGIDNQKWPSMQELRRRGKNFVVILDSKYATAPYVHSLDTINFFLHKGDVFKVNTNDEDTSITAALLADRYVARHFPVGWTCLLGAGDTGWLGAVENGFTFPASNCAARSSNFHHPPVPTFVCCSSISSDGRGGPASAFSGPTAVSDAVAMVQAHQDAKGISAIPIVIAPGTYSAPARISTVVTLTAEFGVVRLE